MELVRSQREAEVGGEEERSLTISAELDTRHELNISDVRPHLALPDNT